jgi:hypothetical protein
MKTKEATVPISQAAIQALFHRFAAPLAPYVMSSPQRRGGAEVMVRALWTAMIAGPEAETETWKVFQEQAHLADEDLQAVKDCYYQKMRPVVSEGQLAALRERYGVKKKDSIPEDTE